MEIEVLDENDEIEYINDAGTAFIFATVPAGETEVGACGTGPQTLNTGQLSQSHGADWVFFCWADADVAIDCRLSSKEHVPSIHHNRHFTAKHTLHDAGYC